MQSFHYWIKFGMKFEFLGFLVVTKYLKAELSLMVVWLIFRKLCGLKSDGYIQLLRGQYYFM